MKLLPLYVYRHGKSDCTLGGVSGYCDEIYIPCEEGFIDSAKVDPKLIFTPVSVDANYHKLVPTVNPGNKWTMFGGNLAATSDSRGSKYVYKIHDRIEH
jgi:hypothetical protein